MFTAFRTIQNLSCKDKTVTAPVTNSYYSQIFAISRNYVFMFYSHGTYILEVIGLLLSILLEHSTTHLVQTLSFVEQYAV